MGEDGGVQACRPLVLRAAVPLVILGLSVVTCAYYPEVRGALGYRVPMKDGVSSCRVRRGDSEAAVRARCGDPCGRGAVPKSGDCPGMPSQGALTLCSHDCDIYGDQAVCYLAASVVEVQPRAEVLLVEPCGWDAR